MMHRLSVEPVHVPAGTWMHEWFTCAGALARRAQTWHLATGDVLWRPRWYAPHALAVCGRRTPAYTRPGSDHLPGHGLEMADLPPGDAVVCATCLRSRMGRGLAAVR